MKVNKSFINYLFQLISIENDRLKIIRMKQIENPQDSIKIGEPPRLKVRRKPLTEEALNSLYRAIMYLPLNLLQLVPPLHLYSISELEYYIVNMLHNPPTIELDIDSLRNLMVPFDINEDFAIVSMIRMNPGPFSFELVQRFSYAFKPIRTAHQIANRIEELQMASNEEREYIIQKFADETFKEYLSSQVKDGNSEQLTELNLTKRDFDICTISKPKNPEIPIPPEIDQEINLLSSHRWMFIKERFASNDLAIIRSEKHEFYMRLCAIIIGRNSPQGEVDIDLSYYMKGGCHHVSRQQAILSFQKDYFFYLENIGKRSFRVNGTIVPKGKFCILQPGAIIDFSDILLMFIPNEPLVDKIRKNFNYTVTKAPIKKKRRP
ncbi:hypothetical protein TRFO_38533 [Tritrichomonas foetus]|uniref:FHA domain-containing protein n=1 Tax=Tritrichomonas foetus TaxID=1144522 RepID=A0A1J4J881_9EUKA|nr:hypothetical protein TRFO_38533 [Tritrichomonas foetus]|eukprot:OHS95344.1 hypothetical protein TRFO_38533 [Tritrichomonas foetus]